MKNSPSNYLLRHQRLELAIEKEESFETTQGLAEIFRRTSMHKASQETFWVATYGSRLNVAAVFEVNRGDYLGVNLHIPSLLAGVLVSGSDRFAVAHNHTNNNGRPSKTDIELTELIEQAAQACQLYFEEHLILTPNGRFVSMKSLGYLSTEQTPYDAAAANG